MKNKAKGGSASNEGLSSKMSFNAKEAGAKPNSSNGRPQKRPMKNGMKGC